MSKIFIISGATATGKTSLAIELAKLNRAEVINFDSLLFYRELSIGVAKPTMEEREGVPHHLIDIASVENPLNAKDYIDQAIPLINVKLSHNSPLILVGGSGFYLQALTQGMYEGVQSSDEVLAKSEKLYQDEGITPFREILKFNDPINYEKYPENDHYRIRRAVEYFWQTGSAFSLAQKEKTAQTPYYKKAGWELFHCYLDIEKQQHHELIQKRTKIMLDQGLIDEVKHLISQFSPDLKPLQSIGYKETIQYLAGEQGLDWLKEKIFIATRRLAKAQKTWFKSKQKNSYNILTERDKIIQDYREFFNI